MFLGIVEQPRDGAHVADHALGAPLGVSVPALDQRHHAAHQSEIALFLGELDASVRDGHGSLMREDRQEVAVVLGELPAATAAADEEDPFEIPPHPEKHRPLEAGLAERLELIRAGVLGLELL